MADKDRSEGRSRRKNSSAQVDQEFFQVSKQRGADCQAGHVYHEELDELASHRFAAGILVGPSPVPVKIADHRSGERNDLGPDTG